jgi:DNA-directed RNA polymerase subunit RPC12/RpoP
MDELACPKCKSNRLVKSGLKWYHGTRNQQYLCNNCGTITIHPIHLPHRDNKGRFIPHADTSTTAIVSNTPVNQS